MVPDDRAAATHPAAAGLNERAMPAAGRRHFDWLTGPKTAHVIVDLQQGFLAPGSSFEVPAARGVVDQVNRLSLAVRRAGGINVFLRFTVDENEPQPWSVHQELTSVAALELTAETFSRETPTHGLWRELTVDPDDLVLDKTRLSAFVPGTCTLEDELRSRGIETLIITGTLTNGCCESTARDAAQRNYRVIFVADAMAAWSPAEHDAAVANIAAFFGDVRPTGEVLQLLEAAGAAKAAPGDARATASGSS